MFHGRSICHPSHNVMHLLCCANQEQAALTTSLGQCTLLCSQLTSVLQVRHIGVSNETSWGVAQWVMCAAQSGGPKIISIQNCYNLLVRTAFETDLCETCSPKNANVGLLAYSPLAGGVLSGGWSSVAVLQRWIGLDLPFPLLLLQSHHLPQLTTSHQW